MPSFTISTSNNQSTGPIVQIGIIPGNLAEEALQKAGKQLPQPIQVSALIDTGSTNTVISEGIGAKLGLYPVGVANISTPSSINVQCYQYLLRMIFPKQIIIEAVVIEAPLKDQPVQCLIGRDILAHGILVYIGYMNQFTLSF